LRIGLQDAILPYVALCFLAGCGGSPPSLVVAVNAGVEGDALKAAAREFGLAQSLKVEIVDLPYANLFEKELLDLSHFRYRVMSGRRPRNSYLHVREERRHVIGPIVMFCCSPVDSGKLLAGSVAPSLAHEFGQRLGGISIDDGLHVVERIIGFASRIDPVRI